MTPGITASQMPPWPKERLGLTPQADAIVPSSAESHTVKEVVTNKSLNVFRPHHIYHPLPPMDQVRPLEKAKGFYLPDIRDAQKVDMRGYQCYRRNLEAVQRHQSEMDKADISYGCTTADEDSTIVEERQQ